MLFSPRPVLSISKTCFLSGSWIQFGRACRQRKKRCRQRNGRGIRQQACLLGVEGDGGVGRVCRQLRFLAYSAAALVLSFVTGETAAQVVPTNAALQALPSTQYPSVIRLGFSSPGDGGRATYVSSGSACSLNGGNGDAGSQVKSADGKCWLADFDAGAASVKVFGAIGDGVTNDVTPLRSCLAFSAARHAACRVPASVTLAVDDVTVPSGARLIGDGAQSSGIRRIAFSSRGNGVLHCRRCSDGTISDLGIDGNKANETVASAVIHFTGYSSIAINRASILGAKGGDGVWLDNSSARSASGLSTIVDSLVYSN